MSHPVANLPFKFYMAPKCPYAQRVSIALHETGLITNIAEGKSHNGDVELVHIDLTNKPAWYKDVNPSGKVPALEITHKDGKKEVLIESIPLAQFVLHAANHPALLATDALKRYRAGIVIEAVTGEFAGPFFGLLKEKVPENQPAAATKLLDAIRAVQETLAKSGGPYALGAEFSIADLISAPFLARMPLNEHYRGFTVPQTEEFARFNQWRAALLERPSVKDTTASVDYLIAAYRSWAI